MGKFTALATAAVAIFGAVNGDSVQKRQSGGKLPPVRSEGNAFWTGNGERFYIRGVAYQPGGAADAQDPLLDTKALERDIENFKKLGINTIRIYTVDNSQNHDEAMKMLDDAGIYLALDANTPKYSLNRESLMSLHASYNDVYLQSVFATVEAFKDYNNLLLFFSGNEVINARNNTNAAPYIKAVTRDIRQYVDARADRPIPVGYSSADVAENIEEQALYFACGDDEWARSDFFAFNDYSWCSPSSLSTSGWDKKVQTYSNYPHPMFLSEFGCITNTRDWSEVKALYSSQVTKAWSGGLAYEYTLEENGYGLVEQSGNSVEPNKDFDRLRQAYKQTPDPSGDGGARKDDTSVPECPKRSSEWQVSTENLPAIPKGAIKYMKEGAGKGPGLDSKGDGSQWAGTPSTTKPDLSDGQSSSSNPSGGSGGSKSGGEEGAAASISATRAALVASAVCVLAVFLS